MTSVYVVDNSWYNNNNNSLFLCSAFQDRRPSQSALQIYIINPVIGFRLTRTQFMRILHSRGSIPARRHFYKRTLANLTTFTFASYRVPIERTCVREDVWDSFLGNQKAVQRCMPPAGKVARKIKLQQTSGHH